MTDRPGPPPAADPDDADPDNADPDNADPDAMAPARRRRRWLRWAALGVAALVLAAGGTGWWLYHQLDGNIRTDTDTARELARYESERPVAAVAGARNILLIGSDSRGGGNGEYGEDNGTQRSDTAILLHLAADRHGATAVSLPRDLMTEIPRCRKPDGTQLEAQFAPFNRAYEAAGTACTIRTVETLTGIRVDHHVIVDFTGFKKLVDAVDGVEVCLRSPIDDRKAHLRLPAGTQTLRGEQALGFVRARYSMGDGSDTDRMGRQQEFLGSLVKKMQSDGVLLNPVRLYPVLDAATSSLTTDAGLDTLRKLYDLVREVRGIPAGGVQFMTVPRRPYAYNSDRDELVEPDARRLFDALRNDRTVSVVKQIRTQDGGPRGGGKSPGPSSGPGTPRTPSPRASQPGAGPTYEGTTAEQDVCK